MDFLSIAFPSSLGTEAILFAVYGFFYTAYAQNYSVLTKANVDPAPIVVTLRGMCRVIAGLIVLNALLSVYSLYAMGLTGVTNLALGGGFTLSVVSVALISVIWAFKFMA